MKDTCSPVPFASWYLSMFISTHAATERHHRSSTKKTSRKEVCMPHLDSARTTYYDKPHGKRVVGKNNCETKKWRPNGCDAWFANIGTPAPSVYSARSRSSSRPEASARSTASHRSTGSQRRSARSAHSARSGRDSAASSVAGASVSKPAWSQSAAELWDKKIQLERQLEAIREEQDALMCRQIAEMSHVCFDRRAE